MIFLSITGSFAAAVYYDKRETARIQKHYCDMVAPLAEKTLPTTMLPRKMTIYLQAPPADGLRSAREHFYDYVKPVLVAGAMDWDVVEGRREGDLRFGTAEKIRRWRRRAEGVAEEGETTKEMAVQEQRERVGCHEEEGVKGDVVVGRHAWKEYLRGVHEGWMGPLKEPVVMDDAQETKSHLDGAPSLGDAAIKAAADLATPNTPPTASTGSSSTTDSASTNSEPETQQPEAAKEEEKPKPKNTKPAAYLPISAYASASLASSTPSTLDPAIPLPLPHLLGFWNFPIRIWRFLNRRQVAEEVSRRTAAAVLASYREWLPSDADFALHEEKEWHKSVRKSRVEETNDQGALVKEREERVWLDDVVVDQRLAERMRIFELPAGSETESSQ